MQIYWTTINQIIDETPEVKTFLLDCPEDFIWEEGAHTHFALEGFNEGDSPNRSLIRHMSISTTAEENLIGITTRIKEFPSEFKSVLSGLKIGDKVALFKTGSNCMLKRDNRNLYFLSSGVSLATFRPLAVNYLKNSEDINHVYSLNVDSSKDYLFTDIFETNFDNKITSHFVDNRDAYYEELKKLADDKNGLFYIVGSDEFLAQNIALLREAGISDDNLLLDKYEKRRAEFLAS